ncbi:MAG: cell wall anchor protein [Muribaculaceae bacterium]|nr:cell wall anchor protein [Muribaculaceae bacterium]
MKKLLILIISLMTLTAAQGANAFLKARIDSAVLLMGKTTWLHLELVTDKGVSYVFPNDQVDTLHSMVEIVERPTAKKVDLGNNRVQVNKDYLIQSFDSGLWAIKPIVCLVGEGDTVLSNALSLKVVPVEVDEKGDIQDYAAVEKAPSKFFDWVPDFIVDLWWLWLALLVLAALTYAYFKWWRKGKLPFKHEKKRLPPYEEAMQRLAQLKEQQLWQQGMEKEYYTELTDILREYIDRRFNINAVEMTTTQIKETLLNNEQTMPVNDQLNEILEIADFVKFANQHPLADDNERSLQRAINFVEHTRPVEEEAKTAEEENPAAQEGGEA